MRWTKPAIRSLVENLEAVHGQPQFAFRFEPIDELVSCILSQHTTDATSFPTFHKLREQAPDWEIVVAMAPERLAEIIRPAGLANQKAKSIIGTLREIHSRNGDFTLEPLREMKLTDARKWLLSLPGVGQKTAAIVLCFAFGRPAIPVDTHVFRVSWRLGLIPKSIGEAKAHAQLEKLVSPDLAFRFHTALVQHGRQICKAPTPKCLACPVSSRCQYFKSVIAK
ncbi:MAG: endonuclease III [Armatimonadota bacterium]|nr:endonuclease III [Armatimonadota bacterium]